MMKKTFHLGSLGYTIMLVFFLGFFLLGLFLLFTGLHNLFIDKQFGEIVLIVSSVYIMYLFSFALFYNLHNKIIFSEEEIVITGHLIVKNEGLQFPDKIKYDEIRNVSIICANANSLKKRIKGSVYTSLRPYTYFEFELTSGNTKWVFLECFSKRQQIQMLNIINNYTNLDLSYNQLEKKDFSIYSKKAK